MKTKSSFLSSMGLTDGAKRALWAAYVLKAATISSPAVPISLAVPAVAARPAVISQPAYAARPASAAIAANPSNPEILAGALFLNSPAFAAGAAVPAFPAKAATVAISAQDAIVASPAIPAVIAPAIKALPGWSDAIEITKSPELITITAYLPYASSPSLIGVPFNENSITEITPSALIADKWLDADRGGELGTNGIDIDPRNSVEIYLYSAATQCYQDCVITDVIKVVNGVNLACKKLVFLLAATNYDPMSDSLQLSKLSLPINNYGG